MATKKIDPYNVLNHAALHCRFGSDSFDRTPDQADLDAAKILERLRGDWAVEKLAAR